MESLRELDKIAYVRFASVYRDFQDEQAFFNELKTDAAKNALDVPSAEVTHPIVDIDRFPVT